MMCSKKIGIRPLHPVEWALDVAMTPVMYALQCFKLEAPQRTHVWNNTKLTHAETAYLREDMMIVRKGDQSAKAARVNVCRVNLPRFHIPCFGGWKKYIVLKPAQTLTEEWYVGWIAGQHIGVSRIPITDMVRVLIGPDDSTFFAVTQDGTQLPLQCTSEGEIGSGGLYRWVPLH